MNRFLLIMLLGGLLLIGCAGPNPNPIDTSGSIYFEHRSAVFKMQAPGKWSQVQDSAPTEAVGVFTDPTGRASLIGYAGLLERRLPGEEGLTAVGRLGQTLLRSPSEYEARGHVRESDGVFEVTFTFTRDDQKFAGKAVFRDTDLALSGVIISGPEQGWADLEKRLTPYVDLFRIDPTIVQGSYFTPLEGDYYALAVPIDWTIQQQANGAEVRSRNGRMSILLLQHDLGAPIDPAALADQATTSLRQTFQLTTKLVGSEPASAGRLKVTLNQSDNRVIGYVEQFDTHIVGLFFKIPADRAADYQPFMDFVYSTYISGLP